MDFSTLWRFLLFAIVGYLAVRWLMTLMLVWMQAGPYRSMLQEADGGPGTNLPQTKAAENSGGSDRETSGRTG